MMKKLLFYGGTFDPPHSGHLNLLRQTVRRHHFDRIIVMPTAKPPHKIAPEFLSDEKRITALKMLCAGIRNLTVSDWEIRKGGKSYSIETITHLSECYPDYEIHFLMGSDMFLSFENWVQADKLAKLCKPIVAPRCRGDVPLLAPHAKHLEEKLGVESIVLQIPPMEKSSTELRSGGQDISMPLEISYYLYGESALQPLMAYLRENLSPEKYEHSIRVAEYAAHLADQHGGDRAKIYLSSLLHDATKCWGKAGQLGYLHKRHYKLQPEDKQAPQIFHQITGALFAADRFRVQDREILGAIKCHTTGRERMNTTDKILFLADSIEPARSFEGVQEIRDMAEQNLDKAVLMNFDRSITYIISKGFFLHPQTVAARNWMLKNSISEGKRNGR